MPEQLEPPLGFTPASEPKIEAPDWSDIGRALGVGTATSGVWSTFWGSFTDGIPRIIAWAVSLLTRLATPLVTWFARLVLVTKEQLDPALVELAAVGVADLFGLPLEQVRSGVGGGAAGQARVAAGMGQQVVTALFGAFAGPGARSLEPGHTGVERYLDVILTMSFRGWLVAWIAEVIGAGQIETFGTLDERVANTMGLGRLTRRLLAPPLSILIEQPFEQELNQLYRPKLLGAPEAVRQFLRGRWSTDQMQTELGRQGYSAERQEALVNAASHHLGVADVVRLINHDRWSPEQGAQHLRDGGMSQTIAETLIELERIKPLEDYYHGTAEAALRAYVSRDISEAELRGMLRLANIPDRDRELYIAQATLRQAIASKDLTHAQAVEAWSRGIIGQADFRGYLERQGYREANVQTLELIALADLRDKTEADARRAAIERQRQLDRDAGHVIELSLGEAETAVRRGTLTMVQFRAYLTRRRYTPEAQAVLIASVQDELAEAEAAAAAAARKQELRARARGAGVDPDIPLGQADDFVKRGLWTVDMYREYLLGRGYSDGLALALTSLLSRELDQERQAAAAREAERVAREAAREAERAAAATRRREAEAAAAAARTAREAQARAREEAREISFADAEKLVREGVWTMVAYTDYLLAREITPTNAELMTRLFTLELAEERDAELERQAELAARAARQEAARGAAAQRRSDREAAAARARAERLRLQGERETRATQRAAARRDAAAHARAERERIAAERAHARAVAAAAAKTERERIAAERAAERLEAARPEISVSDFESLVKRGLRSIDEYALHLEDEGYHDVDVDRMVELLQAEIDEAAATAAARAESAAARRRPA